MCLKFRTNIFCGYLHLNWHFSAYFPHTPSHLFSRLSPKIIGRASANLLLKQPANQADLLWCLLCMAPWKASDPAVDVLVMFLLCRPKNLNVGHTTFVFRRLGFVTEKAIVEMGVMKIPRLVVSWKFAVCMIAITCFQNAVSTTQSVNALNKDPQVTRDPPHMKHKDRSPPHQAKSCAACNCIVTVFRYLCRF